jgi:hypothetical protein
MLQRGQLLSAPIIVRADSQARAPPSPTADIREPATLAAIGNALGDPADIVLSDMAPNRPARSNAFSPRGRTHLIPGKNLTSALGR